MKATGDTGTFAESFCPVPAVRLYASVIKTGVIFRELQALRGTQTLTKEMQNEYIIKTETNAVKEKHFFFFEIKQQIEMTGLGQKIISL